MLSLFYSLNTTFIFNDAPEPWQKYFQDSATPSMQSLVDLHDRVSFFLIVILVFISWMLSSIGYRCSSANNKLKYKYENHGTLIELIWTISPALILVAIAFPSFKLLYLMDEVTATQLTIKAIGHQWYWSYEYSDYTTVKDGGDESISFDSYMVPTTDLEPGALRLLEVDNRVVVPVDTHVRFITTSTDVIHSFAVPSLGLKIDSVPGRLNQVSVLIQREGVFYGQCSEICGVWHGFMPIVIQAVSLEKYLLWLSEQLDA